VNGLVMLVYVVRECD